jgi:para-nitrobenzyl esterase
MHPHYVPPMFLRASTAIFSLLALGCASGIPLRVTLPDGDLLGRTYERTDVLLGVPYAEPPLGERRFAPPHRVAHAEIAIDATRSVPWCPQFIPATGVRMSGTDEDCLYLNVWAPADRSVPHPVMIYLHGGAFVLGSGAQHEFDGRHLSEAAGVVVVTINYRLGALGFAAHPALAAEDASWPTTGNYGLLDQIEAMRWVQRNIAAVGGDPSNVTLFGESAGAASVCMHLLLRESRGLFHRAILESAPCTGFDLPTREAAEAQSLALAEALGCVDEDLDSVRACLRAADSTDVIGGLPLNTDIITGAGVGWGPIVDRVFLTDQPRSLFLGHQSADVPIIVGANADEGELFVLMGGLDEEATLREALLDLYAPAVVEAVIGRYGLEPTVRDAASRILTDILVCDARRIARLHTAAGHRAYQYHFARGFYDAVLRMGAFHGAEIPYVFGNSLGRLPRFAVLPELRESIQGYWGAMAANGDPNGGERVHWPLYEMDDDAALVLDTETEATRGVHAEACNFWDEQLYGTH